MAVTDKTTLIDYIKRQLGFPVIKIEIADTQIDDIIDDALDLFREYHTDALKLKWVFLDITTTEQEYDVPNSTFSIVDIFGYNSQSLSGPDGDDQGYMMKGAYVGNTGLFEDEYSAVDVEVIRQRFALYRSEVRRDYLFDYSYLERKIKFMTDIKKDEKVAVLTYSYLDDEDANYSSYWFKRWCVAQTGLLWASNIGKYGNVSLPGGATYNYSDIFNKYNELRQELKEDIIDRYSDPFFVSIG